MKTLIFTLALLTSINFYTRATEWLVFNGNNSGLPSNSVKAISFDNETVWIGTISGLALYNRGSWNVYNTSNSGLENNYIRCISIDNSGTKWIGTSNGLVSVNGNPNERAWQVFNTGNSGLPLNNITSVAVDASNRKWFGTWGGGLSSLQNGVWENFDMYNSAIPANGIYDVRVDAMNNLWVATHGGGLVKYNGAVWQVFNADNSNLPSNLVYAIEFDAQGYVWLGTESGLVKFDGTSQWTTYNASNTGWNFAAVNCVKYDPADGSIYFGTYYGLGILKNGNFQFMKTSNSGISHNWISAIGCDSEGNKWIATLGGGVSVYNANGIHLSDEMIQELEMRPAINVSPNPAGNSAVFTVYFPQRENAAITIYDLCGRVINSFVIEDFNEMGAGSVSVDLTALPSGIYFYTMVSGTVRISSKFVRV